MKRDNLKNSVDSQRVDGADLQEFEASSEYYERRSRIRFKWQQGDWWIAIGLYLVLVGVALVVL
jgi:hypothetical protein